MASHIQIGDVTPRVQYSGNGTETQFYYPFPIFKDSDLGVYCDDVLKATGYTVSGAGDSAGGYIVFATAPLASEIVTLTRRLTIERISDFQESAAFRSKVLNDELDYQTAALQQLDDAHRRALHIRPHDTTNEEMYLPAQTARAGKALGFDANGLPAVSNMTISELEAGAVDAAISASNAGAHKVAAQSAAAAAEISAVAAASVAGDVVSTFTPWATFATPGDVAATYSSQVGRATLREGRCTFDIALVVSPLTHSTSSGAFRIRGLPYTAASGMYYNQVVINFHNGALSYPVGCSWVAAKVVCGTDYIELIALGDGVNGNSITFAEILSGGSPNFRISGNYPIA